MRTVSIIADDKLHNASVKDVMTKCFLISDSFCSRLKRRNNSITVNGLPKYTNYHLKSGEVLTVIVSDASKDSHIAPMYYPLSIVFEDEDLIIIEKPNGLPVHPARDSSEITLENALAFYMQNSDDNPHPVSRLDRGTTGLMTFAKSGWAHSWMKTVQLNGNFQKVYLGICEGTPSPAEGIINAPIGFDHGSNYKRMISDSGCPAVSEYKVLQTNGIISLIKLIPHTGRTHQLRLHMSSIGHPLVGDWLYGNRSNIIDRPSLHSSELSFINPLNHMEYHFTSPLPSDMQCIIKNKQS